MIGASEESAVELDALLEALLRLHHCDFRGYSRASLERGVARAIQALGVSTTSQLREVVALDPRALRVLIGSLTTPVSDLFRDPGYFRALRERVVPHLATYPSIRVWVAGCGSGEEAYSIAIVLHEAGLLHRSLIYATDIDEGCLSTARTGKYDAARLAGFSDSYRAAGGGRSLSDYLQESAASVTFDEWLRERILFSEHSLATDAAFAEVQLVSCRNVLIYFGRALRERALDVFCHALCSRGFLGLGAKETLALSSDAACFEPFAHDERIYRRT